MLHALGQCRRSVLIQLFTNITSVPCTLILSRTIIVSWTRRVHAGEIEKRKSGILSWLSMLLRVDVNDSCTHIFTLLNPKRFRLIIRIPMSMSCFWLLEIIFYWSIRYLCTSERNENDLSGLKRFVILSVLRFDPALGIRFFTLHSNILLFFSVASPKEEGTACALRLPNITWLTSSDNNIWQLLNSVYRRARENKSKTI